MKADESESKPKKPEEPSDDGLTEVVPPPAKTPLYQATHALRYQRQALIKKIEERTGHQLICYIAGIEAPIERDDVVAFVDLLHNVQPDRDLDLMLHTPGGDGDAAEKLISLARKKVGKGALRVVVPDYAKSAGTLMALGADAVCMSDSSELGPIDPQVVRSDQSGNRAQFSVQCYLDAYDDHTAALQKNPNDVAAQIMLGQLDPATVKRYQAVRDRARVLAEDLLKRGMFRNGGNWSKTAGELLDTKRWQSHAQMISYEDAQVLGLTIEPLDADSQDWQDYWQLYCLQRLAISDRQKLFESNYASLVIDSTL